MAKDRSRDVVVVVTDGVMLLDLAGPIQVLNDSGGYRVRLASLNGRAVRTDVGVTASVDLALTSVSADIDILIVPGYPRHEFSSLTPELVAAVRRIAPRAHRVVSVCTGAFLLAEAGLLDGRRATTHWAACAEFAQRFPQVTWEQDALYVRDGHLITSAGASAGIDLALALVGEDHGEDQARTIAKYLVVFLQRPGGQRQFSICRAADTPRHPVLKRALRLVSAEPAADHRLPALAVRLAVSERHLTRLFRRELGSSPGQIVERLRVEAAQTLLETSDTAMPEVAAASGFRSQETMRQAFRRVLGIAPSAYRHRFRLSNQRPLAAEDQPEPFSAGHAGDALPGD